MNYSVPVSARMSLRELKTIFLRCPMRQSGSLIGSIAWLHQNQARLSRTKHGLVLVDLGDGGSFTYKKAGDVMPKLVGRRSTVLRHSGMNLMSENLILTDTTSVNTARRGSTFR